MRYSEVSEITQSNDQWDPLIKLLINFKMVTEIIDLSFYTQSSGWHLEFFQSQSCLKSLPSGKWELETPTFRQHLKAHHHKSP